MLDHIADADDAAERACLSTTGMWRIRRSVITVHTRSFTTPAPRSAMAQVMPQSEMIPTIRHPSSDTTQS
jgi:hypothetical protein